MLQEHLNLLLQVDPYFCQFWEESGAPERGQFIKIASSIDKCIVGQLTSPIEWHRKAHSFLKRKLVRIQHKEFEYARIPKDWPSFVRDDAAKQELLEGSLTLLQNFAAGLPNQEHAFKLYGNIKRAESLDKKLSYHRDFGNAVQRNELDTRDIVRFRFVAEDIERLTQMGLALWETFFDQVIGCHNYYFWPKSGAADDPYRAIHFQIEILPFRMIELQLLTLAREVVCYLDYALLFKRLAPFLNNDHQIWLSDFRLKANVLDAAREWPASFPSIFFNEN